MGETAPASRTGSQVGRYLLKRLLGHGATGEVYEAVDSTTEQTVAVKLISSALCQDPVFREQMQQDAYVVSRLRGPHIVPLNDFGDIDGQLFLETPLVDGSDLSTLLDQVGALPPSRAVNIVRQAAAALDSAHALGIIHGNIKPHNILVADGDAVHLVDFAISSGSSETDEQWKYAAPELFLEADVDPSIDIYALAGVLYHCLTGSAPYAGESIETLATAHLTQPIPRPSQCSSDVPAGFDAVIAKGMAKDPRERYASAGALDLAAYQALSQAAPASDADADMTSKPPVATATAQIPPPADTEQTPPATLIQPVAANDAEPGPPAEAAPPVPPAPPRQEQPPPASPPHQAAAGVPPPPPTVPTATGWNPRVGHVAPGPPRTPAPSAARPTTLDAWRDPLSGHRSGGSGNRNRLLWIGAALAVVATLVFWLANRSGDDESTTESQPTESAAPDTSAATPANEAQSRLFKLLPAGYPPNVCRPTVPLGGAVAEVSCGRNVDIGGPSSATYTLYPDLGALRLSFDTTVQTSSVVICPGRIQSPGAWHRATSPDKSSGMLLCAIRQNIPTLVWTNDADLVVSAIQADHPGATLEQLYSWWSSHS